MSIRSDYVEGAGTSPVGYLEAIYVKPNFRKSNVAKELFNVCESWALQNSCTEMGSNTWLDNLESQKFHEKLGFQEDDRLVHYIKKID